MQNRYNLVTFNFQGLKTFNIVSVDSILKIDCMQLNCTRLIKKNLGEVEFLKNFIAIGAVLNQSFGFI